MQIKPCSKDGCICPGEWRPILIVNLIGQTVAEKSVTLAIPILLCSKDKDEARVDNILTKQGWIKFQAAVLRTRKKRINRDTARIKWVSRDEIGRVIH